MDALKIIGWYGRRNSGDEAFREVHRLLLPDLPLTWYTPGQQPNFQPGIATREDVVLVSAGDIISPFYFDRVPASARIIIYGTGLGWESQVDLLVSVADRLEAVWVRNHEDVAILAERGIDSRYTPDIVFNLAPVVQPAPKSSGRKRAYIMVSDNERADTLRQNNLSRFLALQNSLSELGLIASFLQKWYDVYFIPFSFDKNDYDIAAIYDVFPRIPDPKSREKIQIIDSEMGPLDALNFLGGADLVVTMKLHGMIYAVLNNVPFVAISDARKVRVFCQENGLGAHYLPMKGLTTAAFEAALARAESDEAREMMSNVLTDLTQKAQSEAELFRELAMRVLG